MDSKFNSEKQKGNIIVNIITIIFNLIIMLCMTLIRFCISLILPYKLMDSEYKNKIISRAKIADDLEKREEYLKAWRSPFKGSLWRLMLFYIIGLLIMAHVQAMNLLEDRTREVYWLCIIWAFLFVIWVLIIVYIYYKIKSMKNDIITSNTSLMCFEGEITEANKTMGRHKDYFVILNGDIRLKVDSSIYYKSHKEKSVRVYFFEKELKKYNKYFLELSPKNSTAKFDCSDNSNIFENNSNDIGYETKNDIFENDSNTININDIKKNCISKIIDNSQISNELSIKDILLKYNSEQQKWNNIASIILPILLCIFFTGFIISLLLPYHMYKTDNIISAILFFIAFCLPLLWLSIVTIQGTNDCYKAKEVVINSNTPLMCFESNILDIYKEKAITRGGSRIGWRLQANVILEDEIILSISAEQLEKIKNSNFKHIKIYFLEPVLRGSNRDLRILEKPEITFVEFF